MAFNDFVQTELPLRPFAVSDGTAGQIPVRSSNPLAARELVWVDMPASQPAGVQLAASVALSGHRAITTTDQREATYASNLTQGHAFSVLGISTNAAVQGGTVSVATSGTEIQEPSWSWAVNDPVYLGGDGVLVQSPPTEPALFSLPLGYATASDRIFVSIGTPVFLF